MSGMYDPTFLMPNRDEIIKQNNLPPHDIAEQIEKMTSKSVSRVNVIIDGVRTDDEKGEEDEWGDEPHID